MSSATTPLPKTMSSRLLTMKFMQRAAASSSAASPVASSPQIPDLPSPKRRKTDSGSTPTKFDVDALADQRAIQAALASEEAKRQIALDRQAAEAGDTRWTLSFEEQGRVNQRRPQEVPIRVVEMGWSSVDSGNRRSTFIMEEEEEDQEDEKPAMVGRRSFGKFNKVVEKTQDDDDSSSDSESQQESDSESDSSLDPDDPASQLIKAEREAAVARVRAERKNRRKAERATSEKLARERQKREVNLNGMMSLTGRQDVRPDIKCFECGGPHRKDECPNLRRNRKRRLEAGAEDGSRRKAQRSR